MDVILGAEIHLLWFFCCLCFLGHLFFLFQWWEQRSIDHQDRLEANQSVSSRAEVRNKAVAINLWVFKHCKMETTPTFPGKNLNTSANSMEKEYIMYWLLFRIGKRCKSLGGETLDVVIQFRQGRSQQTELIAQYSVSECVFIKSSNKAGYSRRNRLLNMLSLFHVIPSGLR